MTHLGSSDFSLAPPNVIELPDDDEDVPLRPRKKKATASKTSQSEPTTERVIQWTEDVSKVSVTFADPVSSVRPASSIAPEHVSTIQLHALDLQAAASGSSIPFFATHHVPESQSDAATEAIRQVGIMMERVKTVHESSQAAYDASAALRANVQVNELPTKFVLL